MVGKNPEPGALPDCNQRLREALRQVRELRKLTDDLLERASHSGGPRDSADERSTDLEVEADKIEAPPASGGTRR